MALSIPSGSPAVNFREIDLSGYEERDQSNVGAYVGNFRWGPVEQPTLIANEAGLVSAFGAPNDATALDFLTATSFLIYSNALQVVRVVTSAARNAYDGDAGSAPLIKSSTDFDAQISSLADSDHTFIAKYPGDVGNTLKISVCPATSGQFTSWAYAGEFDAAPGTSAWTSARSGSNDEVHVVVLDEDGLLTGSAGSVLEKFAFVSLASDAKTEDGATNYIIDVINKKSQFVSLAGFGASGVKFDTNSGSVASGVNFAAGSLSAFNLSLTNGVASGTVTSSEISTGVDTLADPETIMIDYLIAPGMTSSANQVTVVNDMVATVDSVSGRRDCVVVTSPARNDIVNSSTPVTSAVTTAGSFTTSSYLVVDNNYLKVYDRYNDKYRFIPAAGSTAGLMAATSINQGPWYSPAGQRRGRYLGVTGLAYSPTKAERDTLYKAGINPVANIPGQGILLYGDKTFLNRPSAFDRINVRKLFLTLERMIANHAKNILFEFNDEFTRAEFVGVVEPLLREVQGGRGITDFLVVCDETNNTPAVIDRNEFVASIFIKPARSINYITLNFVAVRTGVAFEEVVGTI